MKKGIGIFIGLLVIVGGYILVSDGKASVDEPRIVTSFYPLEYFVSEIVGDTVEVVNIGKNNDPHEFTPSAKDIVTMQEAALVVLQGAGLESWSEDVEHQLEEAGVPVFVANERLALYERKEDLHEDHENHEHEEEEHDVHEQDHDHEDEHGHDDGHDHDHGAYDPHTWLDPVLAAETVGYLTEEIVALYPEYKSVYEANAQMLIQKLSELDAAYSAALSPEVCSVDEALVSHNAFGYIARRYGFTMHPIAGISTQDKPSAKLLAELKEEAEDGVLAVLTEENSVKKYAETVAQETGIMLIPINALPTGFQGGDYIDGMRSNLESLTKAYGCAE